MAALDRTRIAVTRQLRAMNANSYEIGVKEIPKDGKMILRRWSAQQIVGSLSWLKYQNMQRQHIYIRPQGNQGLIMLDDANQAIVKQLHADGLTPACVIESSPLNFQVWLRLSTDPIANETATEVAQYLAEHYGTDKAAADWRRFGRLAGFTNVKPVHVDKRGRSPFSLLSESTGAMVSYPEAIFDAADDRIREREVQQTLKFDAVPSNELADVFFKRELNRLMARYGKKKWKPSHGDWMIGARMMQAGFSDLDIAGAIAAHSPEIHERKRGRVHQYIDITLKALHRRFAE